MRKLIGYIRFPCRVEVNGEVIRNWAFSANLWLRPYSNPTLFFVVGGTYADILKDWLEARLPEWHCRWIPNYNYYRFEGEDPLKRLEELERLGWLLKGGREKLLAILLRET
jgi:hypothetical protein